MAPRPDPANPRLRQFAYLALVAITAAALIAATIVPKPLGEAIIETEARAAFPNAAGEIGRYSTATQAHLLRYRGDPALAAAARHALARYPEHAPDVLRHHGAESAFQEVLRRHGAAVVPPVAYYRRHDLVSLEMRAAIARVTGTSSGDGEAGPWTDLTPAARGRYAIRSITAMGHDFLGQFAVGDDGKLARIQSERWASGAKRFFTSGITRLERRLKGEGHPDPGDYAWAAVDVLAPIAAVKVVKMSKAGQAAKASRTGKTGARTGKASLRGLRFTRGSTGLGLVGTVGYLALHPSLLNSVAHELAAWLDWPVWLMQAALWFAVLLPALVLARWVGSGLGRPTARAMAWILLRLAGPKPTTGNTH